jgi:hypothetical protein
VDNFRINPHIKIPKPSYKSIIANAYYAGVIEFITNEQGIKTPNWVFKKKYYLNDPFFVSGFTNFVYRVLTMIETPVEFKTRNIFLGEDTFSRC